MAATSKEEYLKKYLSGNDEQKKKKKKKKPGQAPAKAIKSRIVDDDVDFKSLLPKNLSNTLEEDVGDNEPIVADFVDERPEHVKMLEKYRSSGAWKVIGEDGKIAEKQRHDSDSDKSPVRKPRYDSESDQSPKRKKHDSDSDHSPERRQRHDSDSDQSPKRRQRHDSDSDQSPKRKRHDSDSDQSPVRKQRHDSDSDQSPVRKQKVKGDNSKREHVQLKNKSTAKRHDSDSDFSPPRKSRRDSDSDLSPHRKQRHSSDSDNSPVRNRRKDTEYDSKRSREEKTLSGKRAGLSSAQEMRREAEELRRKEDEKFQQISAERLGKDAATVFRDKSGKKRNLAEEKAKLSEEAKEQAKKDEQYQKWGKGLKQIEHQTQLAADALHEADKPLARYKDDEDLDTMLRNMDRAEDPMLAFITKKKSKNAGPPKKEKPRYKGPAPPPNRFGIMPGYRWDGVDRSNGFEKQIYTKQAERKAKSEQAYKWSVEDM